MHASFEAVRGLGESALRDLLAAGEPAERVWAAWALALRLDGASTVRLIQAAGCDPDEGIRRHMVVLLTGLGEYEAVAAMAADPAPQVRATACQYLIRLAAVRPEAWTRLALLLRDPAPVVRETILIHLPGDAPAGVRAAVEACIADEREEVREAALACAEASSGLSAPLKAWAPREPAVALRRRMFALWRRQAGWAALLAALESEDQLLDALDSAEGETIDWPALVALAGSSSRLVKARIFELCEARPGEAPIAWALEYALLHHSWAALEFVVALTPRLARMANLGEKEQWLLSRVARGAAHESGEQEGIQEMLVQVRRLTGGSVRT